MLKIGDNTSTILLHFDNTAFLGTIMSQLLLGILLVIGVVIIVVCVVLWVAVGFQVGLQESELFVCLVT